MVSLLDKIIQYIDWTLFLIMAAGNLAFIIELITVFVVKDAVKVIFINKGLNTSIWGGVS